MNVSMPATIQIPEIQIHPEQDMAAAVVSVDNVCKSFGSLKVLDGVSLRIRHGETLAVLGRSGTGKSVLLRLIIGLVVPDSGSIVVNGNNHTGLALDQLGEIRK